MMHDLAMDDVAHDAVASLPVVVLAQDVISAECVGAVRLQAAERSRGSWDEELMHRNGHLSLLTACFARHHFDDVQRGNVTFAAVATAFYPF